MARDCTTATAVTSSAQPNEALLAAITSLAALAGEAGEAPLRKLIGELGAAIAAFGSGEATVAPVTAAASTEGASTPRSPARRSTHQAKPRRATRRHGRNLASRRIRPPEPAWQELRDQVRARMAEQSLGFGDLATGRTRTARYTRR